MSLAYLFYLLFIFGSYLRKSDGKNRRNLFDDIGLPFSLLFILRFLSSEIRWEKPSKSVLITFAHLSTRYLFYGSYLSPLASAFKPIMQSWAIKRLAVDLWSGFHTYEYAHTYTLIHKGETNSRFPPPIVLVCYIQYSVLRTNPWLRSLKVGYEQCTFVHLGVHCATDKYPLLKLTLDN
jgi:hypothetical protein